MEQCCCTGLSNADIKPAIPLQTASVIHSPLRGVSCRQSPYVRRTCDCRGTALCTECADLLRILKRDGLQIHDLGPGEYCHVQQGHQYLQGCNQVRVRKSIHRENRLRQQGKRWNLRLQNFSQQSHKQQAVQSSTGLADWLVVGRKVVHLVEKSDRNGNAAIGHTREQPRSKSCLRSSFSWQQPLLHAVLVDYPSGALSARMGSRARHELQQGLRRERER